MSAKIWAVLQQREGKIHRMAWECVAAAQRLAEELGGQAEAVLLGAGVGPLAEQVAASELAAVRTLDHPLLDGYTPGGYVASLAAAIGAESPDYVLFPHTYQSVEYVPLLAQTVGGALVPEAVGFEVEGTTAYPTLAELTTAGTVLMDEMPVNPYNGLSNVIAATSVEAAARTVSGTAAGWRYYVDNSADPPVAIFFANSDDETKVSDGSGGFKTANEL